MTDWQERITTETAPSIRIEHELRYRIAAPLILSAEVWVDLGCGNGLAAAAALDEQRPPHAVLVDLDAAAVQRAASSLGLPGAMQIAGDLTDPQLLSRITETTLAHDGARVVSCFEVVEHLSTFLPLLEWATRLADEHDATFVLSVPNDAFWSVENPHHVSVWSEGSFEELLQMLPAEQTLLRQVALAGSAMLAWDAAPSNRDLSIVAGGESAVATHFIVSFGPRHAEITTGALAAQANQLEQRRWERQREANLVLTEQVNREQKQVILEQHEALRENVKTFEEWRTYIHELERELGWPLSGQPDAAAAPQTGTEDASAGTDAPPGGAEPADGSQ